MNSRMKTKWKLTKETAALTTAIVALISQLISLSGQLVPKFESFLKNLLPKSSNLFLSEDPFLKYYIIAALVFCALIWLVTKFCKESQRIVLRIIFIATAVLTTLIVIWRGVDVHFYLVNPDKYPLPKDFILDNGTVVLSYTPNYLPYFLLLGAVLLIIITLILYYTGKKEGQKDRVPILIEFGVLAFYLTLCRIAWQIIDARLLIH